MDRVKLAAKSIIICTICQLIQMVGSFITRYFTVRYLGIELLGLHGVITECVAVLSLAEMGITSSMVFHLYEPLNKKQYNKIASLMQSYRKIYNGIAAIIFIIGVAVSFFLKLVVTKVSYDWTFIYVSYYLQLISVVCTYLFSYRRLLINADQRKYVCVTVDTISMQAANFLKIFVLVYFKSYMLFLIITIANSIVSNIVLYIYSSKYYKMCLEKGQKEKGILRLLMHDTKDILLSKISAYIYGSTDSVIISAVLGTGLVGYLSNYKFISKGINMLLLNAMSGMTGIIGNHLHSGAGQTDIFKVLRVYEFMRYCAVILVGVPFLCMADEFIGVWIGKEYILPFSATVLLFLDFYISLIYGLFREYIQGAGLFELEKNVMITAAVINVIISLIGAYTVGMEGVLLGTVVCQIIYWIGTAKIVFFHILRGSEWQKQYIKTQIWQIVCMVCIYCVCTFISGQIGVSDSYIQLIAKGILFELLIIVMLWVTMHRKTEYQLMISMIKRLF